MSVLHFQPIIINNGQVHNSTLTSNRDEQSNVKSYNNTRRTQHSYLQKQKQQINGLNNAKYVSNSTLSEVDRNATATTITSNQTISSKDYLKRSTATFASTSLSATTNNEIIYKFYVPRDIGIATARITFAQVCSHCPDVGFHIQANALPSRGTEAERSYESNYIHSTIIKPNQTGQISIEFYVQPMAWHYAILEFVTQGSFMVNRISGQTQPEAKKNEQMQLRNTEQMHRLKRQRMFVKMPTKSEGNETTTWYHLAYILQIDYHEPSVDVEDKEDANFPNGMENETNNDGIGNASCSNANRCNKKKNAWQPKNFRDMEFYPLLRQTYREFFMFDYDLVPDENGTVPTVLNLTAGMPAGFSFDVGEVYDIGGTLSFAVSMKHGNKASEEETVKPTHIIPTTNERGGILAEKLIGGPSIGLNDNHEGNGSEGDQQKSEAKSLPRSNQTIIVCMHLGEPGEPTWPDKCRYGRRLIPASSIVNNTDLNTSTGLIHVPFPESGQWYVTMGLYCHGAETTSRATIIDSVKEFVKKYVHMLDLMRQPCACAAKFPHYRDCINDRKCLNAMNETETLKIKECLMDSKCTTNHLEMTKQFEGHHKFATEQHFALDNCSTSVVFTVSSSPCVAGRCGRFGRCFHYMSGGFVFSTCVCMKGYRGWDCTEDSEVPSSMSLLLASLLLTLSNLLFIPSIYMAVRRKFYTEGVIYFFAMFFSIFYHACDSGEDEYSFCLVKIGVLQFCDFYCGLLAIWVTLVAMSHIRQQFVSLLHMLGAILLAFGTELNKQSLWVFLAPALTGICLISASWGMRCYKSRKWFPARKYLIIYMPMGTALVMVGLICYAFLQTKQNYHIVHSVWHMVMALSILCLLPSRKSFMPKC